MSSADAVQYLRSEQVFFSRMPDGQCAILDTERSIYFSLNPVAARIWELLAEPRSVDQLVPLLLREFAVSEAECRQATTAFIGQVAGKALVSRAG